MESQSMGDRANAKSQSRHAEADTALLVKVAEAIASDPRLNVAAALRKGGVVDRTAVRRLQRLWREEGEARLDEARRAVLLRQAEKAKAKKGRTGKAGLKGSSALVTKAVEPVAATFSKGASNDDTGRPVMLKPLSAAPPVSDVIARVVSAAAEPAKVNAIAMARDAKGSAIGRVVSAAVDAPPAQSKKPVPPKNFGKTVEQAPVDATAGAALAKSGSPPASKPALANTVATAPPTVNAVPQRDAPSHAVAGPNPPVIAHAATRTEVDEPAKTRPDAAPRSASAPFEHLPVFGWLEAFERSLKFWQAFNEAMLRLFIPSLGGSKDERRPPPVWPGWR